MAASSIQGCPYRGVPLYVESLQANIKAVLNVVDRQGQTVTPPSSSSSSSLSPSSQRAASETPGVLPQSEPGSVLRHSLIQAPLVEVGGRGGGSG